jgi:thioredoxin 1
MAQAHPRIIATAAEFDSLLRNTTYVVVDFHATWCGPCHAIAPTYAQLASAHTIPGVLEFAKVDVDAVPTVAAQNGVTAMPTFLFFDHGKPYAGRAMIRGVDPYSLKSTVEALSRLAKEEAARKAKRDDEEKKNTKESDQQKKKPEADDTPTVSGGYVMGSQSGSRSDWKMSLRG